MTATSEMHPVLIGIGMALPERVMDNHAVAETLAAHGQETDDDTIQAKTGIVTRRWAEEGEDLYSLGAEAARSALGMAAVDARDLGDIYVGSFGPAGPNIASVVHGEIGAAESCGSLDLNAACAGGIIAMQLAVNSMELERHPAALAMGVEIMSSRVNLGDRRSAILFGDGGGAGVFGWRQGAVKPAGVKMTVPDRNAVYRAGPAHTIVMNGRRVSEHAAYIMPEMARRAAQKAGIADPEDPKAAIDWSQVDYFVPHQANRRLIEMAGGILEVPEEKLIISSVISHGNTSAASVFLGVAEAYRLGTIEPGLKRVLFSALGTGINGAGLYASMWLPERPTNPAATATAS